MQEVSADEKRLDAQFSAIRKCSIYATTVLLYQVTATVVIPGYVWVAISELS